MTSTVDTRAALDAALAEFGKAWRDTDPPEGVDLSEVTEAQAEAIAARTMQACEALAAAYDAHVAAEQNVQAKLDEAADRYSTARAALHAAEAEAAQASEIEQLRTNVERLIIRNNELTRERDAALRAAKRPEDSLDLDTLRRQFSDAADALGRIDQHHNSGRDRLRIANAITVLTDTVRILYHAGGTR